jgi:hypothetical protein
MSLLEQPMYARYTCCTTTEMTLPSENHNCITAVQEAAAREAQLLGELQQLRGEVQQLLLGRAAAAPLPAAAPSWSSTASSPAAGVRGCCFFNEESVC